MGNDGGTIAKRQDLLSMHAQKVVNHKADDNEASLLVSCSMSSQPLYSSKAQSPVVGDFKGRLYLKEKTLEYILNKKLGKISDDEDNFSHIKSMKDLVDVKISWIINDGVPSIECPVTKEQKSEKTTYAYLRTCGCVLSYKLLEDLAKHFKVVEEPIESACPNCSTPFHFNYDIVIINPLKIEKYSAWNDKNYKYLQESLKLSHSKAPLKKKPKAGTSKKRKNDSTTDEPKRKKI
ncbi:Rtf2 RING-finger-domain-containing protein [Scheffersomyces xylosifermentans]|uniref:Rtf2 RING-finger-domain-containing protein n=1 Tax=Scheffersomyces xylosifermentans TaxID=1304137 RepID=UPI00315CAD33